MLSTLSITNYALIDRLNVSFQQGFTTITGETGAGKSILLGGLALVLGKRADLQALKDKDKKCIVEAEFDIANYDINYFFEENGLDYDSKTLLRRELLPSGKSRAFINDTPVTLDILSSLGDHLIDVHSQHQTLQLADSDFQMKLIDALADNEALLTDFKGLMETYRSTRKELAILIEFRDASSKEKEYKSFLLEELQAAQLTLGMQEALEEQFQRLNNIETLLELFAKGHQLLHDEQLGVINTITELKQVSNKLAAFGNQFTVIHERIQSTAIELMDIGTEFLSFQENAETDPQLLEETNTKLQVLYALQKKHNVHNVEELIAIRKVLEKEVSAVEQVDSNITALQNTLDSQEKVLEKKALEIRTRRRAIIPKLQKQLQETLIMLGMPGATFKIEVCPSQYLKTDGKDDLTFLFSANKGMAYGDLKKVASGGELSRIMLTIKSILAKYEKLPTMMFDEIDTGVSGEISNKMADIMKEMSHFMQVFAITHLPQVAAKGDHHFKVYKEDNGTNISTKIKNLDAGERIMELAEMLGGKTLTNSALAHAKELLN